jgi:hypothetical protein
MKNKGTKATKINAYNEYGCQLNMSSPALNKLQARYKRCGCNFFNTAKVTLFVADIQQRFPFTPRSILHRDCYFLHCSVANRKPPAERVSPIPGTKFCLPAVIPFNLLNQKQQTTNNKQQTLNLHPR